jgi:hypothetical protein
MTIKTKRNAACVAIREHDCFESESNSARLRGTLRNVRVDGTSLEELAWDFLSLLEGISDHICLCNSLADYGTEGKISGNDAVHALACTAAPIALWSTLPFQVQLYVVVADGEFYDLVRRDEWMRAC